MPTTPPLRSAIQSLRCRAGNRPGKPAGWGHRRRQTKNSTPFNSISTRGRQYEQGRQAGRQAGSNNRSSGFTLIELVVVIVILGILSATALPKFIDMGKDARVAAVEGMKGAVAAAAELAHSKCAVMSGCDFDGDSGATITMGSATWQLFYGYPIDSTRSGYLGIQEFVSFSGFTHSRIGNSAVFDKDGAPTPAACRVTYTYPNSLGGTPTITTTTTGC